MMRLKAHTPLIQKSRIQIGTILLGFIFLSFSASNVEAQSKKPNVLFIPIDDLKPLLGSYGNQKVQTPNIDRLASQGTVFLNNSCQQAICGPSRASLLTGLYPDQTKVWDLRTKMRDVNPDVVTIPQHFKNNGYTTAGIGKTFDYRCVDGWEYMDKPSWSIPYLHVQSKQYANPEVAKAYQEAEKKIAGQTFSIGYERQKAIANLGDPMSIPATECVEVPDDTYADGANALAAINLLEELSSSGQPFFLSVGFTKPHLPFVAPKKYWDLYDREAISVAEFQEQSKNGPQIAYKGIGELSQYSDMPRSLPVDEETQKRLIHGYMAATSYMDAQVGLLLDKLDELDLSKNTIICLWGDHGFHLGDHGMWTKHTNFEQAVRSPLIISAPKGFDAGETNSPTELVDLFPTLCELAGIEVPQSLPGKSLVPIMKDPSETVRLASMAQYPRGQAMGYTLRNKRYRYVKWVNLDYRAGETRGELVATELYDYQNDPLETMNLAENPEYREVIKSFESEFLKRGVAQTSN